MAAARDRIRKRKTIANPSAIFLMPANPAKGVQGESVGRRGGKGRGGPKTTANKQQGKQINADKELQAAEL